MNRRPIPPFPERLDAARALLARRDAIVDRLGVGWQDQAGAATDAAHRHWQQSADVLRLVFGDRHWQATSRDPGDDHHAHIVAAVSACWRCPHIRNTAPAPCVADLNHRLLLCGRCARTWRKPLDDRRCEICDRAVPAADKFIEFTCQVGYTIASGNIGSTCCGWMFAEAAA